MIIFIHQQVVVKHNIILDSCIVWNAHNTVLGEEALLIYIVPVCYLKTGRYGISLLVYTGNFFNYYEYSTNY